MKNKSNYFFMLSIIFIVIFLIKECIMTVNYYAYQSLECNNLVAAGISSKDQFRIHINLDNLTMYVYKNEDLIKTYPVSGGRSSLPSPEGNWSIVSKDTWGDGFGGAWLGLNVPWGKYGIHGTTEPWFVGKKNVSKGCIRMKNEDVKELYFLVPYCVSVTIEHKEKPFRIIKSGAIGSDVLKLQK